jgi:hypothetical protein
MYSSCSPFIFATTLSKLRPISCATLGASASAMMIARPSTSYAA